MSIKIISNGTSAGTRVYNSDGHEIAGITDIIIEPMSAKDSPVTATLKFMAVQLDIQADEPDDHLKHGTPAQPVTVDGVWYPSMRKAGKGSGKCFAHIRRCGVFDK
jgi:hypothetical protein